MIRKQLIQGAAALGLLVAVPVLAAAETGNYAAINGLKMYYQVQGTGRPLVLLHGGVCTIESCMGQLRAPLAKTWRTIAMEQQAHGRTADIDRPLSVEQMAEDTAALLRQLKVANADIVGYSMGGGIALHLALRHPDLVRKVVIFGTNYNNEGFPPGFLEGFKALKPEQVPAAFREVYEKVAPDPKRWPQLVEKIKDMALTSKGLKAEEMKSIKAPVLVMVGDRDIVTAEHAVQMFRLLPNGKLAVLPDTDHFGFTIRGEWVLSMTQAFLDAPMPQAK
jgi:pimeloyl-ACP methyl ester carboxylesterase